MDRNKTDRLFAHFDSNEIPGVVVGVTQQGKTTYAKAFGMANLEYDLPLSLDSVFQTGSVSKQFTAFAILLLSKEGKIDLDAPAATYLDYFPEFDHDITVRHMIHHVSGIRNSSTFRLINGISQDDAFTVDSDIAMAKRQRSLNFEPDTFYAYSNLAYNLLADIVTKTAGKSFRSYMNDTIFEPLGMKHSFFHDKKFELIKNKAEAYTITPDGILNCPVVHACYGASNLFTTVKDMIKWMEELINPQIFSKAVVKKAFTPHECKNGYKTGYGFGLMVHDYKGRHVVEHPGADAGYVAHVYMVPEENTGVVILSNRRDLAFSNYIRKLLDICLDLPDDTAIYKKIPAEENISGKYYAETDATVYSIVKTDNGVFWSIMDMNIEVLKSHQESYVLPQWGMEFTFGKNGDMQIEHNGNFSTAKRISPADITKEDKAHEGKYLGIEFDTVHDVTITEDALILRNNITGEMPFTKYDNGIFFETFSNMISIKFEKDRMFISAVGSLNVEFKKFGCSTKNRSHDKNSRTMIRKLSS